MSNIPKSERDPTKVTHYVKVLDLRKTLIKYLEEDFGIDKYYLEDGSINPRYWLIKKIRDNIYELSQDMVKCVTAANTIQIYHLFEYDERRKTRRGYKNKRQVLRTDELYNSLFKGEKNEILCKQIE